MPLSKTAAAAAARNAILFKHSVCALPCDITKNGCYFDQPLLGSYGHFNGQVKPVGLNMPDKELDESILNIIMRHPR